MATNNEIMGQRLFPAMRDGKGEAGVKRQRKRLKKRTEKFIENVDKERPEFSPTGKRLKRRNPQRAGGF